MANLKNWLPFRFQRLLRNPEAPPAKARPERGMLPLRDEFDRMFARFFADPLLPPVRDEQWFGDFSPEVFDPKLDVTDDAASLRVTLEAPGVDPKDLRVEVLDGNLVVSGEKRHEATDKDEGCYRTERAYGWFRRTVPLPAEVDAAKVDAKLDKGVLTVTLPKTEAAKKQPVKVAVKA